MGSSSPVYSIALSCNKSHTSTWHCRLGHPYSKTLLFILKSLNVPNSEFSTCSYCDVSKIHRQSLKLSNTITIKSFELLHLDVWGPSSSPTISGFQFYLVLIDDYSWYSWLYLLKNKSDVFTVFSKFEVQVENQFSTTIKVIQSDGGDEFVNKRFTELLSTYGVVH